MYLPLYLYENIFVFVFLCMFFMSGSVGGNGGEKAIYNPCLPTLQTIHNAHIRKLIIRCKMMRTRPSEMGVSLKTLDYQSPSNNWDHRIPGIIKFLWIILRSILSFEMTLTPSDHETQCQFENSVRSQSSYLNQTYLDKLDAY